MRSGCADSCPRLCPASLLLRAFPGGMTNWPEESLEHVYVTIKHAVTLESRHQKGEHQCLIKMCVPLSKPLQTVFSIPLGSSSLLMWFLEFLLLSSLFIFAEITLPLSVLQTKCPVWGSELNITDRWVPAVTLTLYSKVSPQSHHHPPRHARGRSHE